MLVYAEKGQNFIQAVQSLQKTLKTPDDYCDLEFNNIRVRVSKTSNIDDLYTIYNLKHVINRLRLGYKD